MTLPTISVTYKYHSSHFDDGDGDVFNHFDIHLGENYFGSKDEMGIEYYNPYFELNDELEGLLIDRYLKDDEGLRWFVEYTYSLNHRDK